MKLKQIYNQLFERNYTELQSKANFCVIEINKYKNRLLNQNLNNNEIEGELNDICFDYDIQFEYKDGHADFSEYSEVGINGARYYTNGRLIVFYDEMFYETFEDDHLFDRFLKMLKIVLIHEYTHQMQISNMKVEPKGTMGINGDYEYYSNVQEIMAHAHEAIQQLIDDGYSQNDIKDLLRSPENNDGPSYQESNAFFVYYQWFYDTDKKVWDKFLKYCYQYLEQLI